MQSNEAFSGLACVDCGTVHGADVPGRCPDCGGFLDAQYDYDAVDPDWESFAGEKRGLWSFESLLPFSASDAVSAAEGRTPLVDAPRLAEELGVGRVVVKDEGRNPTGTFLDRGMSLALTAASQHAESDDIEPLALATPGNAGQSAAAYAGRVGLRSYSFVPSRSAFSNKAMINVHGGEMRVVGGRYPQAKDAVDEQLATDYYSLQEFTTPYRHEGAKTLAFEVVADLDGEIPDAVVVPASTGELVVGLEKGFRELREIGLVDDVPPLYAVQPENCAPIVAAVERGADTIEPWEVPDTIVGELEVPDPEGGELALAALDEAGGDAVAVSDDDILASAVAAAQHEAIEVGVAGGAAPAGAWSLAEEGRFGDDDTVVLVNTESGLKTPDVLRSHLMGQGI
ncbi:threonine synthase [Haloprofundus halophilus]|uniref:threonine synthase n=1 Tax=Haloprofundus halophilus TaxID=2283527 RepID=UPI000E446B82|nr:pyridoxal-phosphate dependent enzyme [Haloprofundus halophilus]